MLSGPFPTKAESGPIGKLGESGAAGTIPAVRRSADPRGTALETAGVANALLLIGAERVW